MANRNFPNSRIYTGHVMPVLLDCNFTVDSTNANGISGLVGPYIQSVYMHSSSPGSSNPNPASGTIVIRLQDNFNRAYLNSRSIVSPNSGSAVKIDNSAMTAGVAYTISTLGNATAAKWHAIGVPIGITPAVGVSFIAASNGGAGNVLTSRVMASAAAGSGVASIEGLGSQNLLMSPDPTAGQGYGASLILQCRDYAGALVAPADGSVVSLAFLLSNSNVLINGS